MNKYKAPEENSTIYLDESKEKSRFDYLIYIGRFQPFHNGHKRVVETGCAIADKVIILCGSCNVPRTIKNPFTLQERKNYIKDVFRNTEHKDQIVIRGLNDMASNSEWIIQVQNTIKALTDFDTIEDIKIGIIGHKKDDSSWYLEKLNLEFIEVGIYTDQTNVAKKKIDSTNIRNHFFTNETSEYRNTVSAEMLSWMEDWKDKYWEKYEHLQKEYKFNKEYKKLWKDAPFPVQFLTVDSVVIQNGHILLIQRKTQPGKDLWALPGGFLNENETLREGVLRELKEETKIKVSRNILKNHIKDQVPIPFDNPNRSLRGRTLTHVFVFNLEADPNTGLSLVKGSDDAKDAKWVPLNEFDNMPKEMFEDHYFIAQHFIKQL